MMSRDHPARPAFTAAPGVSITRLPFGGAVLVAGRTLALLECGEPDAARLLALLAPSAGADERSPQLAPGLQPTAARLVDEGWLVPNGGGGR
jgi:hypothetical protein